MRFNRFLNRIHLSGLRKILVVCFVIGALILAYVFLHFSHASKNARLTSDFIAAYNQGSEYSDYLDPLTKQALFDKTTGEGNELVVRALVQSLIQQAKFVTPSQEHPVVPDATGQVSLSAKVVPAKDLLPRLYKTLNDANSAVSQAVKAVLKTPADQNAYINLFNVWGTFLHEQKLEPVERSVNLQQVAANTNWLPGLQSELVSIPLSSQQLLSDNMEQVLAKEGTKFTEILDNLNEHKQVKEPHSTEPETKESINTEATSTEEGTNTTNNLDPQQTNLNDANSSATPTKQIKETANSELATTQATTPQGTAKVSHTGKPVQKEPTNLNQIKTPNSSAKSDANAVTAPSLNKQVGKEQTLNPNNGKKTANANYKKLTANSKVAAINKYYAVKANDTMYELAKTAYASSYTDFYQNVDRYIEAVIKANKLTVKNNTIYLKEGQVLYFPKL